MAIADCGFAPVTVVPGPQGPIPVLAPFMLVQKGPTTAVEIGFSPDHFHHDPARVQQALVATQAAPVNQLVDALLDTGAIE
jgi:hypothetical protein